MSYNKWLKVRCSDEYLEKAKKDSEEIGKNFSDHIRDIVVQFDVVDYRRDIEMGLINEEEE